MAHRHFEGYLHAQIYGKYRPVPPLALIQRVVGYVKEKYTKPLSTAYDVGCGTGQSTGFFASYFNNVIGTDVSPEQIKNAKEHNKIPNVSFLVSPAEKFDNVADSSVQLVTACQAAHWFDLPSFYKEANRILDKDAVLSLFGYEFPYFLTKDQQKNRLLRERLLHLYETELENYVLPGSVQVYIGRYTDAKFQFGHNSRSRVFVFGDPGSERSGDDKLFRDFTREEGYFEDSQTTLSDYIGYCHTWSGFQQFQKINGEKAATDLMNRFKNDLEEIIGREEAQNESFTKRTNFFVLLGRK